MEKVDILSRLQIQQTDSRMSELKSLQNGDTKNPGMKDAAKKFEAYFLEYMLEVMQRSVDAWKDGPDAGSEVYTALAHRCLADYLASAGGIGISRLIEQNLAPADATGAEKMSDQQNPHSLPVRGEITSRYGWRLDPISGQQAFHQGADIAAPVGSPVGASAAGVVAFAGSRAGLGETVVIRHADGLESIYGHLSKIQVTEGETLSKGQLLGLTGNTGRSTGPHLHLEIRRDGQAMDPLRFF